MHLSLSKLVKIAEGTFPREQHFISEKALPTTIYAPNRTGWSQSAAQGGVNTDNTNEAEPSLYQKTSVFSDPEENFDTGLDLSGRLAG